MPLYTLSFFTNPINQFINLISQSKRSIHTFNLFLFIKFQHSVFPFPSFILVTIFKFNIPLFSFFSIFHAKNIEYCCIFININAFFYTQCIYFFYSGMKRISSLLYQFLYLFLYDCACLFSKRNTDITSNIAKYSIEFHFLQGRKGQQSIAVKSFYDNYCSYCTMQN